MEKDSNWQEGLTDDTKAKIHILLDQLLCKQYGIEGTTKVYKNGILIASS